MKSTSVSSCRRAEMDRDDFRGDLSKAKRQLVANQAQLKSVLHFIGNAIVD